MAGSRELRRGDSVRLDTETPSSLDRRWKLSPRCATRSGQRACTERPRREHAAERGSPAICCPAGNTRQLVPSREPGSAQLRRPEPPGRGQSQPPGRPGDRRRGSPRAGPQTADLPCRPLCASVFRVAGREALGVLRLLLHPRIVLFSFPSIEIIKFDCSEKEVRLSEPTGPGGWLAFRGLGLAGGGCRESSLPPTPGLSSGRPLYLLQR